MKDLQNMPAIVTGGASGMGAATARALAKAGCDVTIWDRNLEDAQKIADELGGKAAQCDVTGEESVRAALKNSGPARIVINCAGILAGERIVGREGPASLETFSRVIGVNLIGSFNVMRLTAEAMSKLEPVTDSGERGVIINTASIAAYEGQIGQAAYAASKGGVVSMTLPAARELAQFGIRVLAIAPGAVATPMIGTVSPEIQEALESGIPFPKRMAHPEEFADLALHIVQNEMLNGTVIRLDGAARLPSKPNEKA